MIARAVAAGTGASTGQVSRLGRAKLPPGTPPAAALDASGMFAQVQDAITNGRSPAILRALANQFNKLRLAELTTSGVLARIEQQRAAGRIRAAVWLGWHAEHGDFLGRSQPPSGSTRPLQISGFAELTDALLSSLFQESVATNLQAAVDRGGSGPMGGPIFAVGFEGDPLPVIIIPPANSYTPLPIQPPGAVPIATSTSTGQIEQTPFSLPPLPVGASAIVSPSARAFLNYHERFTAGGRVFPPSFLVPPGSPEGYTPRMYTGSRVLPRGASVVILDDLTQRGPWPGFRDAFFRIAYVGPSVSGDRGNPLPPTLIEGWMSVEDLHLLVPAAARPDKPVGGTTRLGRVQPTGPASVFTADTYRAQLEDAMRKGRSPKNLQSLYNEYARLMTAEGRVPDSLEAISASAAGTGTGLSLANFVDAGTIAAAWTNPGMLEQVIGGLKTVDGALARAQNAQGARSELRDVISSIQARIAELRGGAGTGQISRLGRTRLPEGTAPTVLKPSGYFAQIQDAMTKRRSPLVIEGMMRQFDALPVLFTARSIIPSDDRQFDPATHTPISPPLGDDHPPMGPKNRELILYPSPSIVLNSCNPTPTVKNGEPVYVFETGIGNAPGFTPNLYVPYGILPRQWWLVRSAGGVGFVPAVNGDGTENFVITHDGPSGEIPFRRGPSGLPRMDPVPAELFEPPATGQNTLMAQGAWPPPPMMPVGEPGHPPLPPELTTFEQSVAWSKGHTAIFQAYDAASNGRSQKIVDALYNLYVNTMRDAGLTAYATADRPVTTATPGAPKPILHLGRAKRGLGRSMRPWLGGSPSGIDPASWAAMHMTSCDAAGVAVPPGASLTPAEQAAWKRASDFYAKHAAAALRGDAAAAVHDLYQLYWNEWQSSQLTLKYPLCPEFMTREPNGAAAAATGYGWGYPSTGQEALPPAAQAMLYQFEDARAKGRSSKILVALWSAYNAARAAAGLELQRMPTLFERDVIKGPLSEPGPLPIGSVRRLGRARLPSQADEAVDFGTVTPRARVNAYDATGRHGYSGAYIFGRPGDTSTVLGSVTNGLIVELLGGKMTAACDAGGQSCEYVNVDATRATGGPTLQGWVRSVGPHGETELVPV